MKLLGIKALSACFGDSEKTWKTRIAAGLPVQELATKGKPHVFDSRAVLRWLIEQKTGVPAGGLDPQQERAELDRARRLLAELDYARKSAELIPAHAVEKVWSRATGDARNRLLAIPQKAVPLVQSAESYEGVHAVLETLIHEALQDIHDYDIDVYVREYE